MKSAVNNPSYDTPRSRHAVAIGMWLFLAALLMLFFSGMLLYVLLRLHVYGNAAPGPVNLPAALWFSTAALIAGSFTIHRAVVNVRRERISRFRIQLLITLALALVFLGIQFPALLKILAIHRSMGTGGLRMYGLVFCLISLHAAHVIGGVIALAVVAYKAMKDRYDHENYLGVKYAAAYWHFLDIIWLVMFGMFLVTG
ncbi:MAG: cytochrome c oxidase subunit 3 [Tepidisphaeraceae bacterium]|jgi:heme/copper-type cytochrome/quinol oxidase subunit 3